MGAFGATERRQNHTPFDGWSDSVKEFAHDQLLSRFNPIE